MSKEIAEQKRLLLDTIVKLRDSSMAWIVRKEIAAWTAAAFYVAGLLTISGFVISESDRPLLILVLCIAVLAVLYVFLIFIHAQYSSVYHGIALYAANGPRISRPAVAATDDPFSRYLLGKVCDK